MNEVRHEPQITLYWTRSSVPGNPVCKFGNTHFYISNRTEMIEPLFEYAKTVVHFVPEEVFPIWKNVVNDHVDKVVNEIF